MTTIENDIPKNFVWLVAEVEIEPAELPIISADDDMVPRGMYVHAGDPFDTRHEGLEQRLLCQIVYPHVLLSLGGQVRTMS